MSSDRYIITFAPKDERTDERVDKREVLARAIGREQGFATLSDPNAETGYDVDRFATPILVATLTEDEARTAAAEPDVLRIERDGPIGVPPEADESSILADDDRVESMPKGVLAVDAPTAWGASRGAGVRVAVVDSGIDYTHPDLTQNYRDGVSFVDGEPDAMDQTGHGTHCAGIIAANGDTVGVAPEVDLFAVRVLGAGLGAWSWLIAGVDWCIAHEMDVISMSLSAQSVPEAMRDMCDLAWERNIVMVAAAGNDVGSPVNYPARLGTVVAVSALNDQNTVSMLSNVGPAIEICAPGVQITSTDRGGGYRVRTGTSQATPHVAGAAALAIGSHRFADAVTIRRALAATADTLGAQERSRATGYGRVNASRAARLMDDPGPVLGLP